MPNQQFQSTEGKVLMLQFLVHPEQTPARPVKLFDGMMHFLANNFIMYTHTRTHPFNGPLSGTTRVSQYQNGKTNLDFTETRDSEWQWLQLGHMQVLHLAPDRYHTSTSPLSFLQAGCPSCRPTNSVKALKA